MRKILVNKNPWQTRIAITDEALLQNIYFSHQMAHSIERVFFKGVVTKVLPGIQTAFVNIGQEKAGFLHISEIDRELAFGKLSKHISIDDDEPEIRSKTPPPAPRHNADISKIFKEGESILVQVSKEPVYEKGAKLTTCFTLPGRFIVLMPNIPRIGISKKIEDRAERIRLKELVRQNLPDSMGAIIRTTAEHRQPPEIAQDIAVLVNTWNIIQDAFAKAQPEEKIYEDIELTLQIIRDHLDNDVESIIVDSSEDQKKIYTYVKSIAPEYTQKIKLYTGQTPLFEHLQIEQQIEATLNKKILLKSGGSLIIETTEAMTVVDVNTGKFTGKKSLPDTIFRTNMEAAEEIVRQLRLRNIGGLIVIDFIDMISVSNRQKLFNFFEKTLKERDKLQSVVLKISEFGLVQMTRKRTGKTLIQQLTHACQGCHGLGFVKSIQTEAFSILTHLIQTLKFHQYKHAITIMVHPQIFQQLISKEYDSILELEKLSHCKITISSVDMPINQYKIEEDKK